MIARSFGIEMRRRIADYCAIAVAITLPWSTSGAAISIAAWLVFALASLDWRNAQRELLSPRSLFPVLLFALCVLATLWSEASGPERLRAVQTYVRFLALPVLFLHFGVSQRALHVLVAYLASNVVLLAASYGSFFFPKLVPAKGGIGVPIKSYIAQSFEFIICALGLTAAAFGDWKSRNHRRALILAVLAALFVANVIYVASSRTTLVSLPILCVLMAIYLKRNLSGAIIGFAAGVLVCILAFVTSPYLQSRVDSIKSDVVRYETNVAKTSGGERIEFWRKSLSFMASAPLLGHGAGSTRGLFVQAASGTGASATVSSNPHNQTFFVGIELGAAGVILLWLMWLSHLRLFIGNGRNGNDWIAATGFAVVAANILGSMFNSYLFDFTEGWTYLFAVGVIGGMLQKSRTAGA